LLDVHPGQAREHVFEVSVRIKAAAAATLDDGVDNGAAIPGLRFSDEQPVLFAEGVSGEWHFQPG
jgi:hypothetical protein